MHEKSEAAEDAAFDAVEQRFAPDPRLKSGSMLPVDPCYHADWIKKHMGQYHRSDPICFSPYPYRARNWVERFFNRIKRCRRVAARYDSLASNCPAFVQLAPIRLCLAARYESALGWATVRSEISWNSRYMSRPMSREPWSWSGASGWSITTRGY